MEHDWSELFSCIQIIKRMLSGILEYNMNVSTVPDKGKRELVLRKSHSNMNGILNLTSWFRFVFTTRIYPSVQCTPISCQAFLRASTYPFIHDQIHLHIHAHNCLSIQLCVHASRRDFMDCPKISVFESWNTGGHKWAHTDMLASACTLPHTHVLKYRLRLTRMMTGKLFILFMSLVHFCFMFIYPS